MAQTWGTTAHERKASARTADRARGRSRRSPRRAAAVLGLAGSLAALGAWALVPTPGVAATGSSHAPAPVGPNCVPAKLDHSAAIAGGALTVSPTPESQDASSTAQLSMLGVPAADLVDIRVSGSRSGPHSGRLQAYSQGDGASFILSKPFLGGEQVTVRGDLRRGKSRTPFSWSFVVAEADTDSISLETPPPVPKLSASERQHFVSLPGVEPPTVAVTVDTHKQLRGDLLLAPYAGNGQYGPMILDSFGRLLWFKRLSPGERAADVRVQEYEGHPVLTWWQDPLPFGGRSDAGMVIDDTSYRQVAVVRAGNGYKPDLHAFQILPNGTALMTIFNAVRCNLTAYGGPANGAVADTLVQEVDVRTGLVRYEWHSLDHVSMADSYMPVGHRGGSPHTPWDWFHVNSVSPQPEGRMLINSRNTWATYEVDDRSGQILWQLGGRHSSFSMGPGTETAWQHDVRWESNDTISFFDNGATPKRHEQSRGLIVRVNMAQHRAEFVQSFFHQPALLSASQGNLQPLAGGDWMVGWGQLPYFSEYAPNGELLLDGHLPGGFQSYTVLEAPWQGQPAEPPKVALRAGAKGGLVVYASWNGATDVGSWRVSGGPDAHHMSTIAQVSRSGFETAIDLAQPPAFIAVQAMGESGSFLSGTGALHALPPSPAVKAPASSKARRRG
jgi:arylsulfotransferase ASST